MWGSLILHYSVIMSVASNGPSMYSSAHPWFFSAPMYSIELVKIISLEQFILFFISASTMKYFEMRHIESESFIPIRNDSSLPLMQHGKKYTPAQYLGMYPQIINPKVWRGDNPGWIMTSPLTTPVTDVRIVSLTRSSSKNKAMWLIYVNAWKNF